MRLSPGLRALNSARTAAVVRMARPKITLYVDTVSPFAYEAYYVLRHDEMSKACDITYVPILLGGLMHKCGNTAPMNVKNKDKWINLERLRWARHFSIPMTTSLPQDFPAPTLPVMRALCAIIARSDESEAASDQHHQQPRLTQALDTLFAQHWVHGAPTHKADVLRATLAGLFGDAEADKILTASTTPAIKQALIDNTDRAFASGAFGLPWMECTNAAGHTEGFWGVDHLGQVVQFLGLRGGGGNSGGWRALL